MGHPYRWFGRDETRVFRQCQGAALVLFGAPQWTAQIAEIPANFEAARHRRVTDGFGTLRRAAPTPHRVTSKGFTPGYPKSDPNMVLPGLVIRCMTEHAHESVLRFAQSPHGHSSFQGALRGSRQKCEILCDSTLPIGDYAGSELQSLATLLRARTCRAARVNQAAAVRSSRMIASACATSAVIWS